MTTSAQSQVATPLYDRLVAERDVDPARDVAWRWVWHYVRLWGETSTERADDRQRRAAKALTRLTEAAQ